MDKKKLYFGVLNRFVSETSNGGNNTWQAVAFTSKEDAEKWLKNAGNRTAKLCPRDEAYLAVRRYDTDDVTVYTMPEFVVGCGYLYCSEYKFHNDEKYTG